MCQNQQQQKRNTSQTPINTNLGQNQTFTPMPPPPAPPLPPSPPPSTKLRINKEKVSSAKTKSVKSSNSDLTEEKNIQKLPSQSSCPPPPPPLPADGFKPSKSVAPPDYILACGIYTAANYHLTQIIAKRLFDGIRDPDELLKGVVEVAEVVKDGKVCEVPVKEQFPTEDHLRNVRLIFNHWDDYKVADKNTEVLYRGDTLTGLKEILEQNRIGRLRHPNDLIGQKIEFDRFLSTSTSSDISFLSEARVRWQFTGDGIQVFGRRISDIVSEGEITFPPGTKVQITDISLPTATRTLNNGSHGETMIIVIEATILAENNHLEELKNISIEKTREKK